MNNDLRDYGRVVKVSADWEEKPIIFCPACGTQASPDRYEDHDNAVPWPASRYCPHVIAVHFYNEDVSMVEGPFWESSFDYVHPRYMHLADEEGDGDEMKRFMESIGGLDATSIMFLQLLVSGVYFDFWLTVGFDFNEVE